MEALRISRQRQPPPRKKWRRAAVLWRRANEEAEAVLLITAIRQNERATAKANLGARLPDLPAMKRKRSPLLMPAAKERKRSPLPISAAKEKRKSLWISAK